MTSDRQLPGIEAARAVFDLTYSEIATALQTDPRTVYRWRKGQAPSPGYLSQLQRLEDLAAEVQRTLRREVILDWLSQPAPAFNGRTPREMILSGRSETVLSALGSLNRGFGG